MRPGPPNLALAIVPALVTVIASLLGVPVGATVFGGDRSIGWGDTDIFGSGDLWMDCDHPEAAVLVASFSVYDSVEVTGLEGAVDFCTMPHALPEWWQVEQSGGCREGALTVSADFSSGPSTHQDFWGGHGVADFTYITNHMGDADRVRIAVTVSVDSVFASVPLSPNTEYYAFRLDFAPPTSTPCPGCDYPACFVINELRLLTTTGPVELWADGYSNYARWQGGQGGCPFIVAVQPTSWGRVKSLYR